MGLPVAKLGDQIVGLDTHVVLVPSPGGPIPTPVPMPFSGQLDGNLCASVEIDNKPVATKGSTATNQPPHMPAGGAIISLTSIEAFRAAPGYAVYAAMKAAVESLTRTLALELGPRGIRVNCIAPDVIPTPGIGTPPVRTPLPRAGHVDDVAGAALFLASELSGFVTGATLHVDGGNHAAGGWRRGPNGEWEP